MRLYPMTAVDFQEMFPDDESCLAYLSLLRWHSGFCCPACGHDRAWEMRKGVHRCRLCLHETSVTRGTIFHDTKKPLQMWFMAIWYVVNQKNGVSALGLQQALGLGSYHTAWSWLHKLRTAMVRPGRDRLSGTVEVDQTFVGGPRPGPFGRVSENKAQVLIAAEQTEHGIGRIRLTMIPDGTALSLETALADMVEPGSTIKTDGWLGYAGLSKTYTHNIIEKAGPEDKNITPLAHHVASLLKRWLLGTHQGAVATTYLPYYLDEFTFRFNRRTSSSRGKLFCRLIQQALDYGPVTNKSLKAVNTTYGA
jgi:hypothetical protein